jgi:hypothetical protein
MHLILNPEIVYHSLPDNGNIDTQVVMYEFVPHTRDLFPGATQKA